MNELETLLRRLVREELERLLAGDTAANDDADLKERVAAKVAAMKARRR